MSKGIATIRWRDGRAATQTPFHLDEEIINLGSLKESIALIGTSVDREKQLKAVLGGSKYDVQKVEAAAVMSSGAALVIYEEPWANEETEVEIQKLSSVSTVFVSNIQSMRTEDRVRCYRAGARLVFSDKYAIEEFVAAVNSYLYPKAERFDPFAQLDHDNKKYLARVRREASWTKGDLEKVVLLYRPLIANHFKRAQLLAAEVIVILVKLPQAPQEIAVTGWQNVFQKALISTLVSSLRNGDLTLIIDDILVVVMSAAHSIATKPVLKRMQGHLKQLATPPVKVDLIIKSPTENKTSTEEAEAILREIFKRNEDGFREITKWIGEE